MTALLNIFSSNFIEDSVPPKRKESISEIIEIAISSGVLAPMLIPIGDLISFICFSVNPLEISCSKIRIAFLLDPTKPI